MARSQTVYNLKLGHFISPKHIFAEYLQRWVDELKKTSGGKLNITIFPANDHGAGAELCRLCAHRRRRHHLVSVPAPRPAASRSPSIIQLPYMVGSAEIGTKTLNDPAVLKLIEPEYQGVQDPLSADAISPESAHHDRRRCARPRT